MMVKLAFFTRSSGIASFSTVSAQIPFPDQSSRMILVSEAHIAKNYLSQVSVAIQALTGKFKWLMSGTPLHKYYIFLFHLDPSADFFFKAASRNSTHTSISSGFRKASPLGHLKPNFAP